MKSLLRWGGASLALLLSTAPAAAPTPEVSEAVRHDTSRPMREIIAELPPAAAVDLSAPREVPNIFPKEGVQGQRLPEIDRAAVARGVQSALGGTPAPTTTASFDGLNISQGGGFVPPDTNGDASPVHYIQWVNSTWAIYNKTTGARISGPTPGTSFFAGFGGRCEVDNDGDPIALWDDRAQRWVMSQFSIPSGSNIGVQCVAISTTSDPLGSYHRYEYQFPLFNDYPHIGVWADESGTQSAYLMVTHEFQLVPSQAFGGAAFIAMEREKMLQGLPAKIVRFPGLDAYGAEPAHLEGTVNAPSLSCPVFVHFDATTAEYLLWDMCIDWANTALSTLSPTPVRIAPSAPFIPNFTEVGQLGTANTLDAFGTHIMYRATARAFPAGAPLRLTMVTNQTVETGGGAAGIRWTQFAFDQGPPITPPDPNVILARGGFEDSDVPTPRLLTKRIVDEGTYAPDSAVRWMGGIAVDRSGNIGLGYSRSSASINPKLMVTARTLGDPDGTMRDEQFCSPTTTGSQTGGSGRWGDYASMSVDPADECTFWFTSEYFPTTSSATWSTRICSFRFPECGQPTFDVVVDSARRVEMCAATDPNPTYAVRIGVLDGFNQPVTLSASGFPPGATPTFVPPIVTPVPGTSTLTIAGATALPAGEYSGTITATAAAGTRTATVELGISSATPVAPTLTAPANGTTGVKVRPRLTWSAVAGALSYTVEVATSAAFGATIVASDTVTGTSWDSTVGLTPTTQYFWRVRPSNYCGTATSAVFSFTTGVPGTCPSGTTANIVFQDAFNGGTNGWTTSGTGGSAWSQAVPPVATGFNTTVWFVPNNAVTSDQSLTSPNIALPAGAAAAILSFDAYHSFETDTPPGCWDGGALEAKALADPTFTVQPATRIFTNPYNGTISAGAPLAGRDVWCRPPTGNTQQRTIVDLDSFIGQTIQLRYRASSDSNTVGPPPNGLYLDNLRVEVCQ
jgi:hypothetical protein